MKSVRIILTLLLALTLLPFSCAQGEEGLAGRWTADIQGSTGTLLLESGGSLILLFDEAGSVSVDTGTWSVQQGQLILLIYQGDTLSLEYTLEQDTLSTRNRDDGERTVFAREPWQPPEGVAGDWKGLDTNGAFYLTLGRDNRFSFDYASGEPIGSGHFAAYGETLYLVFSNNTYLAMGYAFSGGGLTITNRFTGDAYPLTRRGAAIQQEATSQPIPAATAKPEPVPTPETASGLAGSWQGTDASGVRVMTFAQSEEPGMSWEESGEEGVHVLKLTQSGELTISYQDVVNAALDRKGAYTATADVLSVEYPDGTKETYRYILLGDSLLLSDALLQNPVTYARLAQPENPMDPALPGTWGGRNSTGYFEFTFRGDGAYAMVLLPNESDSHTGTFTVKGDVLVLSDGTETQEIGYELDGDRMVLDLDVEVYRMSGPLVRETMPETAPSAAADPALTGVWGGMEQGIYVEHVFYADGRYLRFTPSDEPETEAGNYLAGGGALAVLTREGSSQGNYHMKDDTLTLSIAGKEETTFVRRDGILKRME